MRFTVLKSHMDGISGGHTSHGTIDEALGEIHTSRGWDSIEQLHDSIRAWAEQAKIGSIFCTQVSAIVAVPGPGTRKRNRPGR